MAERRIFDFVNEVFYHKTPWNNYPDSEKKIFSPFIINRLISMSPDYIELINYLQQYTIGLLDRREVYKLLVDLLPKSKFFSKYIKADKDDENKVSEKLIQFLCEKFHWNEQETVYNLKLIKNEDLIEYLKEYGYSEKEIKQQFKLK